MVLSSVSVIFNNILKRKSYEEVSVAKFRIIFFLEDTAQAAFVRPLVERLILEEGKDLHNYDLHVVSSSGGGSIRAYKEFVRVAKKRKNLEADVLVVGSDGNCNGFVKRKQQLFDASRGLPYTEVISAVPDPHIERWYLLDSQALARAAGVPVKVVSPTVKCDKNRYKSLLKKAFTDQGVDPPMGGAEYGGLVVKSMDLYKAGTVDHSLRDFIDQVRSWIRLHG
jgi:hypothetical protein